MDEADRVILNHGQPGGGNGRYRNAITNPPPRHLHLRFLGSLQSRLMLLVLLVALLTIAVIFGSASKAARYRDAELRRDLLAQASSMAQAINPERVKKLSFTAADRDLPEFQRLCQQMRGYQTATYWRGLWSVAWRNSQLVFGPESYAEDDPVASPPGTVYQQPPTALQDLFRTRCAFVQGPYTDEYGTFISAFAPVLDPRTGEVLMVVSLDLEATEWQAALVHARWMPSLLALPLVLIMLGSAFTLWRRWRLPEEKRPSLRYAEVWIIAAFGLTLTMAVALASHRLESHLRHQAFHSQSEFQAHQIITAFTGLRDSSLEYLARTFEAAPPLGQDGFHRTIEPLLRGSNLLALEWIQPVAAGQRDAVEARVRAQGLPDFAIWQQGPEGKKEPAAERGVSYPVLQIEPFEENRAILGYDLGSEAVRRAALEKAIETGLPSVTEPLTLLTKTVEPRGFLVFYPVFSDQPPARTLRGLVAAVVQVESFLRSNLTSRQTEDGLLAVAMHQFEANRPPRFLASSAPGYAALPAAATSAHMTGDADWDELRAVFPLFVFGESYALTVQALPGFQAIHPQQAAWMTALAGVLLTTLLTLFTASLLYNETRLETQVQTRTRELHQREAYLAGLLDTLGEGVFTLELPDRHAAATDRRIAYINRAITEIFGYSPDEMTGRPTRMLYPSDDGYLDQGLRLAEGIKQGLVSVHTEQELRHKDGRPILVALHSTFLASDGPSLTVITTMRDITALRRAEERFRRVNHCLLRLGSDFHANINQITALAGDLLGGRCALYHRFVAGKLRVAGQWQTPAEFRCGDDPEGSVCGNVIHHPCGSARFIPDLQESAYARTDPNVLDCNLRSCLGHTVRCGESTIGTLCVFFNEVATPSVEDEYLLGLLAAALAVEKSRQDAEERLRESEARYRQLIENSSDIIYATDTQGHLSYVGAQAVQYGLQPEQMLGEDFLAFILPEDRGHVKAAFVRSLETGEEVATVFRAGLPSGVIPWFEARSRVSRNELGETTGVSGVLRDVTDREVAKQALEQANTELERKVAERTEQLERFFSVGLDLFCIAGCDGRFHLLNQVWETTLGYTRAELMAEIFLNFVHPDDQQATLAALAELSAQSPVTCFINRYRCKDGTYHWLEWHAVPVGQLIYASAHDITKQQEVEANILTAKEAAERANRAKSAFVANMSHEIRTPLNAIIGFARILERDASLAARQAEQAHTITRSGQHLLKLINDILDVSKIEAGSLTLNPVDFCLDDLLGDLEMMFRSRAEAKGLRVLVERQESVPRYVNADEARLQQVLINLMGNAVKLTQTGGVTVRLRADAALDDTGGDREALRLLVEVEDTGPGIPDEDLHRVFDAFQQSKAGKEAGGSGLGLAITRSLVELMGGRITMESRVGKGSCFRFDVPLQLAVEVVKKKVMVSHHVVGLEPGTGPFRILVVDDVQHNRDLLRAILEPIGFEIKEAVNGQEALDTFMEWSPHAVLMDMRMPVVDGYEATRRIKATTKGRTIPVIAVTASAFEEDHEEVMATGMDSYIRKPFKPEEIFGALGKSLGLRYVLAQDAAKAQDKILARPITREDLASLPEKLVSALRQAVEDGNMVELKELIPQVEKLNAEVARELQRLAKKYDYERLNLILEQ